MLPRRHRSYTPRSSISNLWPAGRPAVPPPPHYGHISSATTTVAAATPAARNDNSPKNRFKSYPYHRHPRSHEPSRTRISGVYILPARANVCVSHFVYLLSPCSPIPSPPLHRPLYPSLTHPLFWPPYTAIPFSLTPSRAVCHPSPRNGRPGRRALCSPPFFFRKTATRLYTLQSPLALYLYTQNHPPSRFFTQYFSVFLFVK